MIKDVNFINGIIKSREKYLLSEDDFLRMADAADAEEAFKILRERSFGDLSVGFAAEDYEKAVDAEWNAYVAFLKEYAPSKDFFPLVCAKNDFFNAECAVRSSALSLSEDMFLPYGSVDTKLLKGAAEGRYELVPEYLAKPMKAAAEMLKNGEKSGARIGISFLRAYYAFMLKRVKNKIWKENVVFEIDVKNLSTALRSENAKKAEEFYIGGGAIGVSVLSLVADKNEKKALDKLVATPYHDIVKKGFDGLKDGSLFVFEKIADDLPAKKLKEKRFETEGVLPSLVYYFYITSAMKNARLVMAMKLAGADKETVRARLRECYAK